MDLYAAQRWVYASLTSQLTEFAHTRSWAALAVVLPLGIMFGAVHALTPGHGKSVLASYLVGARLAVLRSLAVAGALALTHVGSAVVLALLAAPLITRTLGGAGRAPLLEMLSWSLLAAVGLWLLLRAMRRRPHLHHEGVMVGVMAGLIPCPLTLFVMLYALARGVTAAGLAFAAAVLAGIAITLGAVALAAVLARDGLLRLLARHGTSIEKLARALDAVSGALLLLIGVGELWRLMPG
jgi:ABC-type nickel/cobalt efflux system permease component RcnA